MKGILIKIQNAPELARKQGVLATLAEALAPETVEAKVLDTIRGKLDDSLKKEGVKASVIVVNQTVGLVPASSGKSSPLLSAAATAIGAVILIAFLRKSK